MLIGGDEWCAPELRRQRREFAAEEGVVQVDDVEAAQRTRQSGERRRVAKLHERAKPVDCHPVEHLALGSTGAGHGEDVDIVAAPREVACVVVGDVPSPPAIRREGGDDLGDPHQRPPGIRSGRGAEFARTGASSARRTIVPTTSSSSSLSARASLLLWVMVAVFGSDT